EGEGQKEQRAEEVAVAAKREQAEETAILADLPQHDIRESADLRIPKELEREQVILNALPQQGLKVITQREQMEPKKEPIIEAKVVKKEPPPIQMESSTRGATEVIAKEERLEQHTLEKESPSRGAREASAHRKVKSSRKKRHTKTESDKVVVKKHEKKEEPISVPKEEAPPIEVISPPRTPRKRKPETPVTTPAHSPLPRQHRMESIEVHKQPPAVSPASVPPNKLTEQQLGVMKEEPAVAKEERKEPVPVKKETLPQVKKEAPPQELVQQKVTTTTTEKVVVKKHEKDEGEALAKKKEPTTAAKEEQPPVEVISPAKTPTKKKAETPVTTPTVSPLPRQHRMESLDVHKQPPAISPAMIPPNILTEMQLAAKKETPSAPKEEVKEPVQVKKEAPPQVVTPQKVTTTTSDRVVTTTAKEGEVTPAEKEPPIELISPEVKKEKKPETPMVTPTVSPQPQQHRMEGVHLEQQPPAISPSTVPPNQLSELKAAVEKTQEPDESAKVQKESAKAEEPARPTKVQKVLGALVAKQSSSTAVAPPTPVPLIVVTEQPKSSPVPPNDVTEQGAQKVQEAKKEPKPEVAAEAPVKEKAAPPPLAAVKAEEPKPEIAAAAPVNEKPAPPPIPKEEPPALVAADVEVAKRQASIITAVARLEPPPIKATVVDIAAPKAKPSKKASKKQRKSKSRDRKTRSLIEPTEWKKEDTMAKPPAQKEVAKPSTSGTKQVEVITKRTVTTTTTEQAAKREAPPAEPKKESLILKPAAPSKSKEAPQKEAKKESSGMIPAGKMKSSESAIKEVPEPKKEKSKESIRKPPVEPKKEESIAKPSAAAKSESTTITTTTTKKVTTVTTVDQQKQEDSMMKPVIPSKSKESAMKEPKKESSI
ncbi:hypothetical protein TELCIR_24965, partial [Teladorsagia circumcincta]